MEMEPVAHDNDMILMSQHGCQTSVGTSLNYKL